MNFTTMNQYFVYAQKKYKEEHDNGTISNYTYCKKCLVLSRLMAQHTIDKYNDAYDDFNKLRRMRERFKYQGVSITTLDMQIAFLLKRCKEIKSFIALLGGAICDCLDGCQCCGATYEDLYNFCCCSEKTISEMKENIRDFQGITLFSELVCIHYPDDKNNGVFIDTCDYAPITHAVKEYMCERMKKACKNSEIRDSINNKMFELFPDMKDCCIIKSVDEFGDTIFTDLDGLPVDFD